MDAISSIVTLRPHLPEIDYSTFRIHRPVSSCPSVHHPRHCFRSVLRFGNHGYRPECTVLARFVRLHVISFKSLMVLEGNAEQENHGNVADVLFPSQSDFIRTQREKSAGDGTDGKLNRVREQETAVRIIDSHTEGEPTRVIIDGGPDLGSGSLRERMERFRQNSDIYRRMAINEPRGSDALVGALLCEPVDTSCAAGVIFFNNTGYLGMCGHGAIGVAVTLAYLQKIEPGVHLLETPVGVVQVDLIGPNHVAIENVPSYRYRANVRVEVEKLGTVTGDIAWGGNWFFLIDQAPAALTRDNIRRLTDAAESVRNQLRRQKITGADGAEIDHIEFFGPPESSDANSRNFVYCPGGAYDRSPCGTGTSAKLACLAADNTLRPGEPWIQESIIGSRFTATYRKDDSGRIIPKITGHAYVCSEALLIQQSGDPFLHGIP